MIQVMLAVILLILFINFAVIGFKSFFHSIKSSVQFRFLFVLQYCDRWILDIWYKIIQ